MRESFQISLIFSIHTGEITELLEGQYDCIGFNNNVADAKPEHDGGELGYWPAVYPPSEAGEPGAAVRPGV